MYIMNVRAQALLSSLQVRYHLDELQQWQVRINSRKNKDTHNDGPRIQSNGSKDVIYYFNTSTRYDNYLKRRVNMSRISFPVLESKSSTCLVIEYIYRRLLNQLFSLWKWSKRCIEWSYDLSNFDFPSNTWKGARYQLIYISFYN